METRTLDRRNIENLTALWAAMGAGSPGGDLPASLRMSTSWPHRCWLGWDASPGEIEALADHVASLPFRGIVPVLPWPAGGAERLESALKDHQFQLRAALQAMVLDLSAARQTWASEPNVERVETPAGIDQWTEVCSEAFGYAIDGAVVHRLAGAEGLQLFLATAGGEPAATALTLQTGDTIGIHQVGVPPRFRGGGLAKGLMGHVMAVCIASGARYATLQASAAGEGIYRKMGFAPQFPILNYRREQPV